MKHSIKDKLKLVSILMTTLIVFSLFSVPVSATTQSFKFTYQHDQTNARKMLDKVNYLRQNNPWLWKNTTSNEKNYLGNLPALRYDYSLEKIAIQRAEDLAENFVCGARPDGSPAYELKIDNIYANGECISIGCPDINSAFAYWEEVDEPNHFQQNRALLLMSDYKSCGIAHVKANGVDYWTIEFSRSSTNTGYTSPNNSTTTKTVNIEMDNAILGVRVNGNDDLNSYAGDEIDLPRVELVLSYGQFHDNILTIPSSDYSITGWSSDDSAVTIKNGKILCNKPSAIGAEVLVNVNYNGKTAVGSVYVRIKDAKFKPDTPTTTPTPKPSTPTPTNKPVTSAPTQKPKPTVTIPANDTKSDQIRAFVDNLYKSVLGRDPEEGGAKYWANRLYNFDITGAEVAKEFVFSQEYISFNKSNSDFLDTLYSAFFGRPADDAGKSFWLGKLDNNEMSRQDVAWGFIDSQEWADKCATYGIRSGGTRKPQVTIDPTDDTNAFVERMYTTALKRTFDKDGRDYWAKRLADFDLTGEQVGIEFFLSKEMNDLNLSDEEFINRLYSTFMNRNADEDPTGKNFWISYLKQGHSRYELVLGFTRSDEFVEKCIKARILPY